MSSALFPQENTDLVATRNSHIEKPFHNSELGTFYSLVTSQESGLVVFRNDDFCFIKLIYTTGNLKVPDKWSLAKEVTLPLVLPR